ncbi:Uncharacterised protein [Klebsiella pneumoniae subsp. rhinoscleromatis]|nr:Uncharacterised protein [Klebsiella pneumoniae subsp. rhinoscleromatis]
MDLSEQLLLVKDNNCLPFCHPEEGQEGSYWTSTEFTSMGFEREKIASCFDKHLRHLILAEVDLGQPQSSSPLPPNEPITNTDHTFRGRETLLDIIAGQAIAIGKISGKHSRASGINKSELVRDIFGAISDYGKGMSVDERQVRSLIAEAITLRAAKITSNEQVINLAAEQEAVSGSSKF